MKEENVNGAVPQGMPAFMKKQIIDADNGDNIFDSADNVEHMEEVDYNRLRELGVDQMAMNAIKDGYFGVKSHR